MHRRGKVGSTSVVYGMVAVMVVLSLVKWWISRTMGANLRPIGGGMRTRTGAGRSERVDFVC